MFYYMGRELFLAAGKKGDILNYWDISESIKAAKVKFHHTVYIEMVYNYAKFQMY